MAHQTDVLIIGTGLSGLACALKLADSLNVALISKKEALESNTRYAQGGIAAVVSHEDDFASHVEDTLHAGAGLCRRDVVEKIVGDAPRLVSELVRWGVGFSHANGKDFDLGQEGGHTHRRILHSNDTTGLEIESSLLNRVREHPRITLIENHYAVDLILSSKISSGNKRCLGAYVLDTATHRILTFKAPVTILATGGAGKVYLYTSNPDIATGDGMAMAYRAGVPIANMEFVQFHPSCLYNPGALAPNMAGAPAAGKSFLISEALRGEGALLKLKDGSPFMAKYDPRQELAPRDIIARAIDFEMKKHGDNYVLLDISHKPADFIRQRFPHIHGTCLKLGYDLARGPIPVVPAAHYFCGGIAASLEGKTSLPGLFAIGEAAHTGFHGANRLASNSLLEACAMADYAAAAIKREFKNYAPVTQNIPDWNPGRATDIDEAVVITQNWDEIRRLMWNYVGIVRSDKRLMRAKRRIDLLSEEIKEYYWNFILTPDLIELRNVAAVAQILVESAMSRNESRGLHYNRDYPRTEDECSKDTMVRL